jgi:hypothetical protein
VNRLNLISFLVPPQFVSYYPIEGSVSYSEGSSMNLSCRAFAVPSANITWIYRDKNKQSKSNYLFQKEFVLAKFIFVFLAIHNGENIYISSLLSSDSGSYECIASNNFHASISRSFYVTVQCKFCKERFYLHEKVIRRSDSIDCESISVRLWVTLLN